jgi:hypothetical protein
MTTIIQQIIDKYHGVAPQGVVHAVQKAAARTGADFSFLMEKASMESGFNPAAKAKSSSATGLFQFIESTWLKMIKEHGAKYGLGALASHIEIRDGKPCVDDCKVRQAILSLRKNPEISALMAGELSTGNKQYLEAHTESAIGKTELSLAHFMGAAGASRFLNARAENGDAIAAHLFHKEAHANKNIFFDPATGRARTLDQVYNAFNGKADDGEIQIAAAAEKPVVVVPAQAHIATAAPSALEIAQMMAAGDPGGIVWNDEENTVKSGFAHSKGFGGQRLSVDNMMLAQMQRDQHRGHQPVYNS